MLEGLRSSWPGHRTASVLERGAGERPLEIWLPGETLAQLDTLKANMRVPSRDAVIGMILRSYLAQQPAIADAAGEARTK